MNAEISSRLASLRTLIEGPTSAGDEAHGPGSVQDTEHSNSEAGTGEALNVSDVEDTLNMYMGDIISDILDNYDLNEDEAEEYVFEMIDQAAEEGLIPEFPEEDGDEDDNLNLAAWLGAAKSAGLERYIHDCALEDSAED